MDFIERQTLRSRSVATQISMPLTLWEIVDRYSDSKQISVSIAITHLVRQGLRREAEEQKAKA